MANSVRGLGGLGPHRRGGLSLPRPLRRPPPRRGAGARASRGPGRRGRSVPEPAAAPKRGGARAPVPAARAPRRERGLRPGVCGFPRFPPLPPPPRAERGARCGETAAGAPAGPAAAPRPREAFGVGCGPSCQGPLTCCVCTGGCAVPVSAPPVAGSVFGDGCVCGCSCRSSSRPSRPPQPHSRPRGPGMPAASAPDASSGLRPQHVHVTPAALVLQKSCALDLCHLL
ncbi:uncharacterized protein LOC141578089 [Camelus bactrianus]|uniref:Uncharacterized protein LOC141578089 n=1 Tax=Camelus bactrianus TaxID=9837 RepID=A0AC58QKB2_CAMBA